MTGLIGYSISAFLAGILLNVMPCVLPVIPFKIQAVMREIGGDIRSRVFAATALLLGSFSFFLVLGGVTAYMGLTWGALFQSGIFLAALSVFLFLAAIATLADWSIPLPPAVYRLKSRRYGGAFLTGALAGILSTPCSGPFLGSVLAYALTRSPGIILVIFSAISLGLATPYVFILLWPGLVSRILTDRVRFSGAWTVQVKQLLGFVLLAGAIFFGRVFIAPSAHLLIWRVFFSAILIWALVALIRAGQWPARIFPLLPIVGSIVLLMMTIPTGHLNWQPFSPTALQATITARQPILLEFTAQWCLNCEVLEKTTYTNPDVVSAAKKAGLVPYRVDMTDFNASHKALLEKYGGTALPYALLIDAEGSVVQTFAGMFSAKTLVQAIHGL
jgi:thiol:disulfide interchange protein